MDWVLRLLHQFVCKAILSNLIHFIVFCDLNIVIMISSFMPIYWLKYWINFMFICWILFWFIIKMIPEENGLILTHDFFHDSLLTELDTTKRSPMNCAHSGNTVHRKSTRQVFNTNKLSRCNGQTCLMTASVRKLCFISDAFVCSEI